MEIPLTGKGTWQSAILHNSLINNTATPKSGCYTLGLETTVVERVVIPYANSPWLCKCRYIFRINKICTQILRLSWYRKRCLRISATSLRKSYPLKSGQHRWPNSKKGEAYNCPWNELNSRDLGQFLAEMWPRCDLKCGFWRENWTPR